MNVKERILATLRGKRTDGRLAWVPTVGVTVEAMKQVDARWPDSHWDPRKMARAAASTYELTGVPCCTVPFCLTLEGEALGCPLDRGSEMTQPQIMEHLESDPGRFELPGDFLSRGRIPAVLEVIAAARREPARYPAGQYESHRPVHDRMRGVRRRAHPARNARGARRRQARAGSCDEGRHRVVPRGDQGGRRHDHDLGPRGERRPAERRSVRRVRADRTRPRCSPPSTSRLRCTSAATPRT